MGLEAAFTGPWRLPPNRIGRFYRGGALLERFRAGELGGARGPFEAGADGTEPEDWVGSSTRVWTPPEDSATSDGPGLAVAGGTTRGIAELLAADPVAVAGERLVDRAGPTTGVLVKLLDAGVRLPVHCHPSRPFARRWLGSLFGKAEAWIVIATRDTGDPEGPTVRIGFRTAFDREELIDVIVDERTDLLLDAMHVQPTRPGDVWFIPPGVPHAIGTGVFMVEIEEPSDFSIVAETGGVPIHPASAHLGLGWEVAIDAFDLEAHDDAWLDALRHDARRPDLEGQGWRRTPLTDVAADAYFRADRLTVRGRAQPDPGPPTFLVGVVTSGAGTVRANDRELAITAGDTFAVPAVAVDSLELDAPDELELIVCQPPDPELL